MGQEFVTIPTRSQDNEPASASNPVRVVAGKPEKDSKDPKGKGKAKAKSPPTQTLGIEFSFGNLFRLKRENPKLIVVEKPKPKLMKRSSSVPPPSPRPFNSPNLGHNTHGGLPIRPNNPIPGPGWPGHHFDQPILQPQPRPQPEMRPWSHPDTRNPGFPPQGRPQTPLRPTNVTPQTGRPYNVVSISPENKPNQKKESSRQKDPVVVIPDRHYGRGRSRSPSSPAAPRRPTKPKGPSDDSGAVKMITAEANDRISELERRLQAAERDTQSARRTAAQEHRLRQLAEHETDLRQRLADARASEQARRAFFAGAQARLIRDQDRGRPVIEQQPHRNRSHERRRSRPAALDLGRAEGRYDSTPPASPYDSDRSRTPRGHYDGHVRARSASQSRNPFSFGGRRERSRDRRPPAAGNGWDTVRRAENGANRGELRRRPSGRAHHEDPWARDI